jgi:hypothetical protein
MLFSRFRLTDAGYDLAGRLEEVERRNQGGAGGEGVCPLPGMHVTLIEK